MGGSGKTSCLATHELFVDLEGYKKSQIVNWRPIQTLTGIRKAFRGIRISARGMLQSFLGEEGRSYAYDVNG